VSLRELLIRLGLAGRVGRVLTSVRVTGCGSFGMALAKMKRPELSFVPHDFHSLAADSTSIFLMGEEEAQTKMPKF
jgi:hypothetical protein